MAIDIEPDQEFVLNPLTGKLDTITGNNFSYKSIPTNKVLTIRENEQMIVYDEFVLDGELVLSGDLILVE